MAPSINPTTYPPGPKPPRLRPSPRSIKRTTALTLLASILLMLYLLIPPTPLPTLETTTLPTPRGPSIRIAKATIAYAPSNNIHARSLALHAAQGHATHVLRTPLVTGFANTFLWLQHVMTRELLKDEHERAGWILFFSPGVIVANKAPLQALLPPPTFEPLLFVGTKPDDRDLNSALFFVRVSPLAIRLLGLAVASVHLHPERQWGEDVVGAALQIVLERNEYRGKVVWQPKQWYNGTSARFVQMRGGGGVTGLLEVERMLERQEVGGRDGVEVPGGDEVDVFWGAVRDARMVLKEAEHRGHTSVEGEFAVWVRALNEWVELRTWDSEGIRKRMEILKRHLGIGEIVGYELSLG